MKKEKDAVLEQYIYKNAMTDAAQSSLIAFPFIIIFEAVMIINWSLRFEHSWALGSAGYMVAYLGLIAVSFFCYFLFLYYRKDCAKNYRKILMWQDIYAMLFFIWALAITILDTVTRANFNVIVYITIMVLIPVFCYINPVFWSVLQIASAAVIIAMALHYTTHVIGFILNFSVLTIISCVAQFSLYHIKRRSYIRQYKLMLLQAQEYRRAHRDDLTGLLNRRSYSERLERLEKNGLPKDLLLVSFDVNGLKQINDSLGHKAGDELLIGAADVIRQVFSEYGEIYRTGGDEYLAILSHGSIDINELNQNLYQQTMNWKGELCGSLSISVGYASHAEHPEWSIIELEKEADQEMYKKKRLYYQNSQNDRRKR